MFVYFSKAEDETSETMKQAVKDAGNGKKSDFERMKAIARAYATKCSVQEAVHLVMPELWLRKTFPKVLFLKAISQKRDIEYSKTKKKYVNYQKIVLIFSSVICWIDTLIGQTRILWLEDIVQLMPCVL